MTPRSIGLLFTALLAAPVAGCITTGQPVGRDFQQAAIARFMLDQTTIEEAEALIGPPMKSTTVQGLAAANSRMLAPGSPYSLTLLSYLYLPYGPGQPRQARPGKAAILVFFNARLIAYGSDSSIPGQANAPIDEGLLTSLHQCKTTRSEAIALLGPPNGETLHLMDAQPGAVDIVYSWSSTQAGLSEQRNLRLFFDRSGAMSNYTLVNSAGPTNGVQMNIPAPQSPQHPGTTLPPACPAHADREHT